MGRKGGFSREKDKRELARVSETLQDFRVWLEGGKSPHTVRVYLHVVRDFAKRIGDKLLSDLTIMDIVEYRNSLKGRDGGRASSATVNFRMSALATYFDFLKRYYGVSTAVLPSEVKQLRRPPGTRVPEYLEEWEVQQILEHCETIEDRIIISLLFYSGLRVSELTSLKVKDLRKKSDGRYELRVRGKGDLERVVPLPVSYTETLEEYLNYRNIQNRYENRSKDFLVPLSSKTVWSRLKRLSEKTGIRVRPHVLRHSYATCLLKKGVSLRVIQELLGHKTPVATAIYTTVTTAEKAEAVDRLG